MTYNVFGGTLNLAQSSLHKLCRIVQCDGNRKATTWVVKEHTSHSLCRWCWCSAVCLKLLVCRLSSLHFYTNSMYTYSICVVFLLAFKKCCNEWRILRCFSSALVADILDIFCHCIYSRASLYFHVYPMLFSCIPLYRQLWCVCISQFTLYTRCDV